MTYRHYDQRLAQDYADACQGRSPISWLLAVQENFTLLLAPSEVSAALDVGCGAGSLISKLVKRGIASVVGVDVSAAQVKLCRRNVANAVFFRGDCRSIGLGKLSQLRAKFNYVNASWIFDAAHSVTDLFAMTQGIARCLEPGGVHTGICLNPKIRVSGAHEWECYGISLLDGWTSERRPVEGEQIEGTLALSRTDSTGVSRGTTLFARYFTHDTYALALDHAGFRDVEFFYPESWPASLICANSLEKAKFESYVHENPEMIAYRARFKPNSVKSPFAIA